MRYLQYRPGPPVSDYVHCLWLLEGESAPEQVISPDGRMELILHYGDRFRQASGLQPRAMVAGQQWRHLRVEATGRVGLVGARFHAWGSNAVLREQAGEWAGVIAEASVPAWWIERIAEARPRQQRLRVFERLLAERLRPVAPPRAVVEAVRMLQSGVGVAGTAARVGVGERQLERLFGAWVGLAPKRFARVARFQRLLRRVGHAPERWAMIAADLGYYDQPHLIREFQELAGCAPSDYNGSSRQLNDWIVGFFQDGGERAAGG
ncbi:MAG: helix-turn-helix domain-containing protein [Bryobacteraceae bacterium]|nr:helix-turn-helix domain-containing protein [Bryobacteraceae bacterium]